MVKKRKVKPKIYIFDYLGKTGEYIKATSINGAKKKLRSKLRVKRLPHGIEYIKSIPYEGNEYVVKK